MTRKRLTTAGPLGLLVFAMVLVALAPPAEARGWGRGSVLIVSPRVSYGFYGPGGYPFYSSRFGWGYLDYGAYGRGYEQPNPTLARALGVGALDLDIKPRSADVFVDGEFVGQVRDFDGYPSFLWLAEGEHTIEIYKGGFANWTRTFDVQKGVVEGVKARLLPGESTPPDSTSPNEVPNGALEEAP